MPASGLSFDDFEQAVASFDVTEPLAGGDRRDLFNVPDVVYPSTDSRAASCKAEIVNLLVDAYQNALDNLRTAVDMYTDEEENWMWAKKGPNKSQLGCVWEILTVLFGVWSTIGMGHVVDGEWVPVDIFLPESLSGKDATERSGGFFHYRCTENHAVHIPLRNINIVNVVRVFVTSLEDCDVFSKTSALYVLPSQNAPQVADAIVEAICSVPDNTSARRARDAGYGIRRVLEPKRTAAAVGDSVVTIPNTLTADEWRGIDATSLPQFHTVVPDKLGIPNVEEGRYFPMSAARTVEFEGLIAFANTEIAKFAHDVYDQPREEAQKYVSMWSILAIHKVAPNFTGLVGAQYLQRIAVLLARTALPSDPRPRAYFPTDEYRDEINADEIQIVGQFLYALGCALFSSITGITILMGVAGSGKTIVTTLLTLLAGGYKRAFILDAHNGAFSTSMLEGAYIAIAEDTENGKIEIPKNLFNATLGRAREDTNCTLNMRKKFKDEKPDQLHPMSLVAQCNFPSGDFDGDDGSLTANIKAAVLGPGVGAARRGMITPPQTEILYNGTANPHHAGFRYNVLPITERDHPDSELAVMWVILATTAVMGNAVADAEHGLMGDDLNPIMTAMCEAWLLAGKNPKGHASNMLHTLLKMSAQTDIGGLTMRQGITRAAIFALYKKATNSTLKSMPSSFATNYPVSVYCRHCSMVFAGLDTVTRASLEAHRSSLYNLNRNNITRQCPVVPSSRCCDSLVTGKIYTDFEPLV